MSRRRTPSAQWRPSHDESEGESTSSGDESVHRSRGHNWSSATHAPSRYERVYESAQMSHGSNRSSAHASSAYAPFARNPQDPMSSLAPETLRPFFNDTSRFPPMPPGVFPDSRSQQRTLEPFLNDPDRFPPMPPGMLPDPDSAESGSEDEDDLGIPGWPPSRLER